MNIFQLPYENRLQDWVNLRDSLKNENLQIAAIKVDNWWQHAPLVAHYLHPKELTSWPDPWELLQDNTYCMLARALGMYYTMILMGTYNVEIVLGKDDNNEEVTLVLVDNAKYILNYYPNTVISNSLTDFNIVEKLDTTALRKIF